MAFSELVNRHQDAVYNLAYQMTRNAAAAEDLAQESFIRAYTRLSQYKPEYPFVNWLLGICANLSRSLYRSLQRQRAFETDYTAEQEMHQQTSTSPSTQAGAGADVSEALQQLPAKLRLPLVLQYMEGLSLQEIADTLGLRLSATKMRLQRGRERMLKLLREEHTR